MLLQFTPENLTQPNNVSDLIKWTITGIPQGTTISWDHPWPNDPTAGQGASATATLTGYPADNSGFGLKTVNMILIRKSDGRQFNPASASIGLFFARDAVAAGRSDPNWFYYWQQTSA